MEGIWITDGFLLIVIIEWKTSVAIYYNKKTSFYKTLFVNYQM